MSFKRQHHQRIEQILRSLNGPLLKEHSCLFGGGTAITLKYGEYRESVDMDFLVSDLTCYRSLRNLVRGSKGMAAIITSPNAGAFQFAEIRADQYGIRSKISVLGQPVKFEIILEGRINLDAPFIKDEILGIATISKTDMAASKLLANSDRWADDSVHSRDIIDLAMMNLPKRQLEKALVKAQSAYGKAIVVDLTKAINQLQNREGLLERCMTAMDITMPRALLWQNIRKLRNITTA